MKYHLIILCCLIGCVSWGQEPTIYTDVSSRSVTQNETFSLQVICNHNLQYDIPNLDEFQLGQGMTTESRSMHIAGNKRVVKNEIITTYPIKALKTGTFVIGSFSIRYNGKVYGSKPITITVREAPKTNSTINEHLAEHFYADYVLNKTDAYVGEPIYIYKKMYSKRGMDDISKPTEGNIIGTVQVKNIGDKDVVQTKRESIQGNIYITASFEEKVIFPMKEGVIQLESYQSSISFGGFFGDMANVKALPRRIKVNPLPDNAPADFTGGVGKYSIYSEINKTEVEIGDVVQLDVKIKGSGNLQLIGEPKLNLPPSFEMYGDPVIEDTFKIDYNGMVGEVNYTYLLKAKKSGSCQIPAVHFSYFDIKSEAYKSVTSDSILIKVIGDEKIEIKDKQTEANQNDEAAVNEFIPQFTTIDDAVTPSQLWMSSVWFKLTPLPLALGFILGFVFKRQEEQKNQKDVKTKIKKANKNALQRFHLAKSELDQGNHNGFYDAMHEAILSYLSDKFDVPKASLSKFTIQQLLDSKKVDQTDCKSLLEAIEACEMARFAMQDSMGDQPFYDKVTSLIQKIDEQL